MRGDRPLGLLRSDVAQAEQALYESFNAAIGERKYEIECRRYTPTGSRVSTRVCEPAYRRILQSETTQQVLSMGGFATGNIDIASVRVAADASPEISREDADLLEKMIVAITENPDVQRAFIDFLQKQQALAATLQQNSTD